MAQHKIRFESVAAESFTDYGLEYSKDKDGNTVPKQILDKPFVIKRNQTMEIDDKTYKYLVKKGAIRTLAEEQERQRLKKKLFHKKARRVEPKKDVQYMDEEEKIMVFNELPFEVEE